MARKYVIIFLLCILFIKDVATQAKAPCNPTQIADEPFAGYCLESCKSLTDAGCDSNTLSGRGPFCALNSGGQYITKNNNICN